MEAHLEIEVEIWEPYKYTREPCIPPWRSVIPSPKGAHKAVHSRPDWFAGILLYVDQRSTRGVNVVKIRSRHRYSLPGWESVDKPNLARKWENPIICPLKKSLNYYSKAWSPGTEEITIPTSANYFIFEKKKKPLSRELSNLTVCYHVVSTIFLTAAARSGGVTSTRSYALWNTTHLKRKTSYIFRNAP